MKLNIMPDIHDELSINGKLVKISSILYAQYNTSGSAKVNTVKCYDAENRKYQFLVFPDMTISKVHPIKQVEKA